MMSQVADTLKSLSKIVLLSRRTDIRKYNHDGRPLIIMGNGPSLKDVIDNESSALKRDCDLMSVNFAANSPEFFDLKPVYHTLADPHFFKALNDPNIKTLFESLNRVNWSMSLFVPHSAIEIAHKLIDNPQITLCRYNNVGVEGWDLLRDIAYNTHLGMPRPRNVLIPSIMIGAWLGYKEIYLVGADHSWTQSLSVAPDNRVVVGLAHFYTEDSNEIERVRNVYADMPLHTLFHNYYVTFKSYHEIQRWAAKHAINIYNATPDSFIDAFPRRPLPPSR